MPGTQTAQPALKTSIQKPLTAVSKSHYHPEARHEGPPRWCLQGRKRWPLIGHRARVQVQVLRAPHQQEMEIPSTAPQNGVTIDSAGTHINRIIHSRWIKNRSPGTVHHRSIFNPHGRSSSMSSPCPVTLALAIMASSRRIRKSPA